MIKCPVCDADNEGLLCQSCGYDGSQNREAYPTLGSFPANITAISSLQETWLTQNQDLIRCESCGGLHFTLNRKTRAITCIKCNLPLNERKKSPLYPPKPSHTPPPASVNINLRPYLTNYVPPDGCCAVATGDNYQGCCNVEIWKQIVALSVSDFHTVGLKSDGTVLAIGNQDHQECQTNQWQNITSIATETFYTYGLKSDGTAIFTGVHPSSKTIESWTDLQSIACSNFHLSGLKKDGSVVTTNPGWKAAKQWTDIKAIASCKYALFGLCQNGTVKAAYNSWIDLPNVKNWENIVAIAAGSKHIVGLHSDGTVIAAGNNSKSQCSLSSWENIIAIAAGGDVTAGLREDGTVVCTNQSLDVSGWNRIISIAVSEDHIVGLQLSKSQYAAQLHFKR